MYGVPDGMTLPRALDDVDAEFMTRLLRARAVISPTNSVVAQQESDVGMTAGYFSAIKRLKCRFAEPTDAQDSYVVKAWPDLEIMPKENIAAMFRKDIKAYLFPPERFYPRPQVLLADFDVADDRWALVMEDIDSFGEQQLHEHELDLDGVLRVVPRLVEVAVAWEGCDEGEKAAVLDDLGVGLWASDENLATFRAVMPGGAKLFDRAMAMADSPLVGHPTWVEAIGPGVAELFTRKVEAFFAAALPGHGATCTLSHGDFREDNLFFCEPSNRYPDGWLIIDFQQMFRGPVPSDLAYLMGSGSVLPEVYEGDAREVVLRTFYDQFMAKTRRYSDYTFDQFRREYAVMTTVLFTYYIGYGAAYWQAGAFQNELPFRVELGGRGATLADLAPDEIRKRMWWKKAFRNFRSNLAAFDQYAQLRSLPDNAGAMGPWTELPDHLT